MKKKALAVLVNDVHLNKSNGDLVKDIFRQLIQVCEDFKTNRIICGGDIFTNRSAQPMICLTDWKDILDMLRKAGVCLDVIPGNHDKTDPDDERSYLDVYSYPEVILHRKGESCIIGGHVFVFVPYFTDEKWLEEFQKADEIRESQFAEGDVEEDACSFLITHSGFDGVKNNDGSEVKSIIKPSMFSEYTKVLIGHYHNASKVGDNVYYTGSAYQGNFGESIKDKGFTVIFDNGSIQNIHSRFPKYIKIVLDVNDSDSIRETIEKYKDDAYNKVRIVFRGKKVDIQKINVSELSEYGIDAKFESVEETEAIDNSVNDDALSYDKKSLMKDFLKFCSENNIKGKNLKYGMNLVKNL